MKAKPQITLQISCWLVESDAEPGKEIKEEAGTFNAEFPAHSYGNLPRAAFHQAMGELYRAIEKKMREHGIFAAGQ